MTDEELQTIRVRATRGNPLGHPSDVGALLAYVDFLRTLLHDLQQDSAAYQRGVEAERERCLNHCEDIERDTGTGYDSWHDGIVEGARRCADAIRTDRCPRCNGTGTVTPDDGWNVPSRCPDCRARKEQRA